MKSQDPSLYLSHIPLSRTLSSGTAILGHLPTGGLYRVHAMVELTTKCRMERALRLQRRP